MVVGRGVVGRITGDFFYIFLWSKSSRFLYDRRLVAGSVRAANRLPCLASNKKKIGRIEFIDALDALDKSDALDAY